MKILVIEDSRFLRLAIDRILSRSGHQITGIADGREGVPAARSESPDVILLDMMLPGLDGPNVLKELKRDPLTALIPVVVLTGLSKLNAEKLKKDGAAAYIEKSALDLESNPELLIRAVEAVSTARVHQAVGATTGR